MPDLLLVDGEYNSGQYFRRILTKWRPERYTITVEYTDIMIKQLIRQLRPDVFILHDNTRYVSTEELIRAAAACNRDMKIILITEDMDKWRQRAMPEVTGILPGDAEPESILTQLDDLLEETAPQAGGAEPEDSAERLSHLARELETGQACFLLRVFAVGGQGRGLDLPSIDRIIAENLGQYSMGWVTEQNGICALIRDIGGENILCSMQVLWQMIQNTAHQLVSSGAIGGGVYALVSQRTEANDVPTVYQKLLEDAQDIYFCRDIPVLSDAFLEAKRTQIDRAAVDAQISALFAAVLARDEVGLLRVLEHIYLGQLKPSFDRNGMTYIRASLAGLYDTLSTVLHRFAMQEPAPEFDFLEDELAWHSRRFEELAASSAGSALRPKTLEALQFIAAHYTEVISLNMLAERLHITNTYISKIFKEDMGIGVVDYINQTRISKAICLMDMHSMKIQEISRAVGFEDAKYFGRVFKNFTGHTPSEYISSGGAAHEMHHTEGKQ